MPANTFGLLFRVTTFGESHGAGVGAVIDGCPAGVFFETDYIQAQLDRRRPGQNSLVSPRNENDRMEVLSGVFEGKTTGAPIAIFIANKDQKSKDYDELREVYRPGHADFTYDKKYGFRDHRGGGRSSARTTAPWVAAGALAQLILKSLGVHIYAFVSSVGEVSVEAPIENLDLREIDKSPVRCPDYETSEAMSKLIAAVKEEGDSLGGIITAIIKGVPAGWGEPQFSKLSADLGHAMLSINAVKGFEIGDGFASARKKGSQTNDAMVTKEDRIGTVSNHAGGIHGGISNGEDIWFKVAFKPVASISKSQQTVNREGAHVQLETHGRHDTCVVPRAVPIVEAMSALVLVDHYLRSKSQSL